VELLLLVVLLLEVVVQLPEVELPQEVQSQEVPSLVGLLERVLVELEPHQLGEVLEELEPLEPE